MESAYLPVSCAILNMDDIGQRLVFLSIPASDGFPKKRLRLEPGDSSNDAEDVIGAVRLDRYYNIERGRHRRESLLRLLHEVCSRLEDLLEVGGHTRLCGGVPRDGVRPFDALRVENAKGHRRHDAIGANTPTCWNENLVGAA